jgi:hypothetical protein
MIGKSNAVLLALLLALPTAFLATAYIAAPAQAQPVLYCVAQNSDFCAWDRNQVIPR